ncbi:MAG: VanZ family protein [Leptolyngbya sp. Prado105]|jgi:glycopeptide antibiotics resistance protein|nr:VanZ family protein [Leptolyngbya sp. Prado105]
MSYSSSPRRSVLITLSSILLILLVTLLPFNFTAEGVTFKSAIRSFFEHESGFSDIIGNIFLFMPFGLDLAYELRQSRIKPRSTFFLVAVLSMALSLSVETLQVFLPWRASSWIDISTNTTGGAIGVLIYLLWQRTFPNGARTIARWVRPWLSTQALTGLSVVWLISASGLCLLLQQELKIGTWHFPLAFMFIFYSTFFIPLGILLAMMTSVLKNEPKVYLMLASAGIVVPAIMIEVLLRGTDLRKANLIVSATIALFTMLVVRGRLGHLLRY